MTKDIMINKNGKYLVDLLTSNNLIILNGRTVNDSKGEFTFVGAVGKSVIDLCCVSENLLAIVKGFSVEPEIYSDHLPLKLTLRVN
jgi:endonuclease/exonuclease/phosphatase family metal-dependent hydrolase